ncbi:MAG: putative hydrolase [Clostridia bacterium]|nr:putative hydrolase [Clostridia bacterium]
MFQSFWADFHVHTIYSDGKANPKAMVDAAQCAGLQTVALTDHGPRNIGVGISTSKEYLRLKREILSREFPAIKVLVGAEANIVGLNGEIDIPLNVIDKLDILLVGLHPFILPTSLKAVRDFVLANQFYKYNDYWKHKAIEVNTRTLIAAMEKYKIFCIAHPGLGMPVDIEALASACARVGTAWEINVGHLFQKPKELAKVARYGVNFVVNSDSHQPSTVGRLEEGLKLIRTAGISPEQVINLRQI